RPAARRGGPDLRARHVDEDQRPDRDRGDPLRPGTRRRSGRGQRAEVDARPPDRSGRRAGRHGLRPGHPRTDRAADDQPAPPGPRMRPGLRARGGQAHAGAGRPDQRVRLRRAELRRSVHRSIIAWRIRMTEMFPLTRTDRPTPRPALDEILADPGFGRYFTDHMAVATWTHGEGWHGHEVRPLTPLALHPGAAVLHYAQEILEGLKAFRHADGSVWLFRPELNARRFAASADRLVLPRIDEETFVESAAALIRADEAWVPAYGGERSLYLRPFMFATESFLGVRPAWEVAYCVIACPAGAYFANGVAGVTLWISTRYTRAVPGGTGAAKCGGNYGA